MRMLLAPVHRKKQDTVKTKKPVKVPVGPLYLVDHHVASILITGDVRRIVKQPKYVETNEWLAASSASSPPLLILLPHPALSLISGWAHGSI